MGKPSSLQTERESNSAARSFLKLQDPVRIPPNRREFALPDTMRAASWNPTQHFIEDSNAGGENSRHAIELQDSMSGVSDGLPCRGVMFCNAAG
jgi:hypothetical protein